MQVPTLLNLSILQTDMSRVTYLFHILKSFDDVATLIKQADVGDMCYLEIDGVNSVGDAGTKGIVKISIAYIDGIIISNNSTVSTNFGYVITSTTSGNSGKVNIDLYLQEIDGENYYNISVSKLVGSAISFESPSAAAITAPSGYVAIS